MELLVPSDNPYVGQTVSEAGLTDVRGGSLIEIVHFDDITSPVPDDEVIMGGDRLVFAGQIDEILDLKKSHELVNADHHIFTMSEVDNNRQLRTAYVNFGSSLINKKIGGSTFEKDNNMILVAVARRGIRIDESPREVILQAGERDFRRIVSRGIVGLQRKVNLSLYFCGLIDLLIHLHTTQGDIVRGTICRIIH